MPFVERLDDAVRDIEEHAVYLGAPNGSSELALRFIKSVEDTFAMLSKMPEMGSPRRISRLAELNLRIWPVREFPSILILYHEIPDGIRVLRVVHARRNWPALVP